MCPPIRTNCHAQLFSFHFTPCKTPYCTTYPPPEVPCTAPSHRIISYPFLSFSTVNHSARRADKGKTSHHVSACFRGYSRHYQQSRPRHWPFKTSSCALGTPPCSPFTLLSNLSAQAFHPGCDPYAPVVRHFPFLELLQDKSMRQRPALFATAKWFSVTGVRDYIDIEHSFADGAGMLPGNLPLQAIRSYDWLARIAIPHLFSITPLPVVVKYYRRDS